MKERERTLQLAKGLEAQGLLVEQFYDQARGVKKPYDLVACCPGGLYWAIETKRMDVPSWESKACLLGPRSFQPKQLENLLKVAKQGGRATVALFVIPPRAIETRAWALSARAVARRFQQDRVYRLEDLLAPEAEPFELVRIPGAAWGLKGAMLQAVTMARAVDLFQEGLG